MRIQSVFLLLFLVGACSAVAQQQPDSPPAGVYSFTLNSIDGKATPLADYRGDVLLIVNTASECGYTPQYAPLEQLYQRFRDRGLRILAFPANNFGGQEPGSNAEIKEFCTSHYAVTFDLFEKISVKGEDIHPLYHYLTAETDFPGDIRWNFTKFLVSRDGTVVARFDTKVDPLDGHVVSQIEGLLNE